MATATETAAAAAGEGGGGGGVPMFRAAEYLALWDQGGGGGGGYMEKRRLFLRSYHFSRRKSGMERVRCSAIRVRRLIWVRLCAARRLPRLLWQRLRCAWSGCRRLRFHRLMHHHRSFSYPSPRQNY